MTPQGCVFPASAGEGSMADRAVTGPEQAFSDSRRGSARWITQPFAYWVNSLSRWLAND